MSRRGAVRGPVALWRGLCAAVLFGSSACAPILPPDTLTELAQVRQAPAAREAARYAPPAYERAERLRSQAQLAFDEGRFAAAQILAEQAHAAYAHAVALARVARGQEARASARTEADRAERELAELDAEHQRVFADIGALELRLKVLRDAEPIVPSGPAKAARERARAEAVAALRLQAKLLCTAARLLDEAPAGAPGAAGAGGGAKAGSPTSSAAQRELQALDQQVAAGPAAAPIDQAMRVRASCLRALTEARRAQKRSSGTSKSADALLGRLSKVGHGAPARDDRGVVVTLRNTFAGDELSESARRALSDLARVAAEHPSFPVMVVLHQAEPVSGKTAERWSRRASVVAGALRRDRAAVEIAGAGHPVVDPAGKYRARNERVEIVFVAPAGP